MIHYAETTYGFEYGAAKVTRIASDEKREWIVLGIATPKENVNVYVTKTGRVRIHVGADEVYRTGQDQGCCHP